MQVTSIKSKDTTTNNPKLIKIQRIKPQVKLRIIQKTKRTGFKRTELSRNDFRIKRSTFH